MTDASVTAPTTAKPPRGRSPNYPGISLPEAIKRARTIYAFAQQHPVPRGTITEKWGFKNPNSGTAAVTYAALTKFGLLEDEGSGANRQGHITNLGVEILVANANQEKAIKRAALLPPIHQEWFARFKEGLPPEETLRFEFVARGPFTSSGFTEFLREYQETISFAKLTASDSLIEESGQDDNGEQDDGEHGHTNQGQHHQKPPPRNLPEGTMSYAIPVAQGENVTIEGEFPLTEAKWTQFMAVLNAMKLGLVGEPEQQGDDNQ